MDEAHWERLARFAAGEASAAERAEVEAWLDADPANRALLHALDAVRVEPPADLDVEAALGRVHERIDADRVRPIRPPAVPTWLLRAAAIAGLVLAGSAILLLRDGGPASYQTAVGRADTVRLPDGSLAILAPASRLTVEPGYGDEAGRRVTLEGVAWFRVQDAPGEFVVLARDAVITDLGTAFTVRADPTSPVRVTVSEGRVRLAPASAPGAGIVLSVGQQATLGSAPVPAAADVAWTNGRLVFEDAPFAYVAAELRRWHGLELAAGDRTMAARHLTAQFEGESAAQIVDVIALALAASRTQRGDTIVLHTR